MDNVFVSNGNFIPSKSLWVEWEQFDEGDCDISSTEDSLFEEEEFDQKVTS